jgi:hypothetical protein
MTAFAHLANLLDTDLTLYKGGEILADGPLEFTGTAFQIEGVCFDSGTVEKILDNGIYLL